MRVGLLDKSCRKGRKLFLHGQDLPAKFKTFFDQPDCLGHGGGALGPDLIGDQGAVFLQLPVELLAGKDAVPPSGPEIPCAGRVFGPDGAGCGVGLGEPLGRGGGPKWGGEGVLGLFQKSGVSTQFFPAGRCEWSTAHSAMKILGCGDIGRKCRLKGTRIGGSYSIREL